MEGSSSIQMRIPGGHGGYALIAIITELAVAAARSVGKGLQALIKAQRLARTRGELHQLNDHFLRDIGVDRHDIDRMFR